jgi:hypothetical protein
MTPCQHSYDTLTFAQIANRDEMLRQQQLIKHHADGKQSRCAMPGTH